MPSAVIVVLFLQLVITSVNTEITTYNIYETPETIISNGYPAERHNVITEDGYILELHRIPSNESNSPIVFLMHGLLAASNSFIALGPKYSVAYNFADAGFDVWMGNARGTRNSRNHTTLNADDPKERKQFFDFSFEEIGIYDIAASVDYILEITGQEKLHYIGHSQGGTVFFVLNSIKPEYNKKFRSAHLLAGVGYQDHYPNNILKRLAKYTDVIYKTAIIAGIVELFPPMTKEVKQDTEDYDPFILCAGNNISTHLCNQLGIPEIIDHIANKSIDIGGAALKQVAHFGQNIRDKVFRRWNYGVIGNLLIYGRLSPPEYDLRLINVNVTMHYTVADMTLDERDVLAMAQDIPNARVRKVNDENFLHTDFVDSINAKKLVTDYVIHAMKTLELTQV